MKRSTRLAILLALTAALLAPSALIGQSPKGKRKARQSRAQKTARLPKRVAWTTSGVKGQPEPPLPYKVELAFPHLKFKSPITLTMAPDLDRLFMVENGGKLYSFPNNRNVRKRDLFFDLAAIKPNLSQTYGLAFHPQFQENRYVFLNYILKGTDPDGTKVSRFKVLTTNPPRIDPKSEEVFITWIAGGHNGCSIKFGPKGYLHISTGDGIGPNPPDAMRGGQDVSNLQSSIFRIDVDNPSGRRPYGIPPDNPFIDLEGARPEIWAYGFRNPWKISFDRLTGDLWTGDVGWEMYEMVYRVERGGNYGWSVMEGPQPVHPDWERGPTPILPPIVAHDHYELRSITGGFVYRGKKYPDLYGAYIYGDYSTGDVWGLRYDGERVTYLEKLADTSLQIIGFAEDHDAELYFFDYETGGKIYELVPNEAEDLSDQFPRTLTEAGIFQSVADHVPAAGVVPYDVASELWADHAYAERLLGLPGKSKIEVQGNGRGKLKFPQGAVLARTVYLDLERGNPDSRRRIETQILHFEQDTWRPYTYVWNDEQTEATLADAAGMDLSFTIRDSSAPGGTIEQTYRVASRTECTMCHTAYHEMQLGVTPNQLNRESTYSHGTENQLVAWQQMGIFGKPLPRHPKKLPRMVDPYDESEPLDLRARSYLHVNCRHCHRPGGGGTSLIHLDFNLSLDEIKTVDAKPSQGTFDLPDARVIAKGDPFRSVLFYRLSKVGRGRMPMIGSHLTDEAGVDLLYDWISGMGKKRRRRASVKAPIPKELKLPVAMLTNGGGSAAAVQTTMIKRMFASTQGALVLSRLISEGRVSESVRDEAIALGTGEVNVNVRDLFERFLPPGERAKRLGDDFKPEAILALEGNPETGKQAFFYGATSQCKNCHAVHGSGGSLGPDLTEIGKKYKTRNELLETILDPSKEIEEKYTSYVVATTGGQVYTGILVEKTNNEIVLRDAESKVIRVPMDEVDEIAKQEKSIMPEKALRDLTAQEAADLLEFLASLK